MRKRLFLAACLILVAGCQSRSSLQQWQDAVKERDAIIETLNQHVSDLETQLTACQTSPTAAPIVKTPPAAPAEPRAEDLTTLAPTIDAIRRVLAATKSGVTRDRYLQLMETVNFEMQNVPGRVETPAIREIMREILACLRSAATLWNDCPPENYTSCRGVTRWVRETYPALTQQYPLLADYKNAHLFYKNTISFLWAVATARLSDLEAL